MENFALLFQGFSSAAAAEYFSGAGWRIYGNRGGGHAGNWFLAGCSLLLPLTFHMNPTTGIIMLAGIYYGNMYGGAFSAILSNIPGDAPAVMTALDGYAMTRKGKAGKASVCRQLCFLRGRNHRYIILTVLAPTLAAWTSSLDLLKWSPAAACICSIGWMMGDDPKYGLISTFLALLALVGMDPVNGQIRFYRRQHQFVL